MKIGIIGQPCIDEIVHPGNSVRKQALGGILYSYAAMERVMREKDAGQDGPQRDTFCPLTWSCLEDTHLLQLFLDQLTHLNAADGLWETFVPTNRVQLIYAEDGSRIEHCPNVLPALTPKECSPEVLSELDGLFINMISGFDIEIDTIESVLAAARPRPWVHLDIHALVLGDLSSSSEHGGSYGGGRQPRGVAEWKRWLALADSVQLNEFEARWLGHPEATSEDELLEFLRHQQALPQEDRRMRYFIVTRGASGASLHDTGGGLPFHVAPPSVATVDTTGAGDVFGAVFLYALLSGSSPQDALQQAVERATWCTTLSTIDDILIHT